MMIPPIVISLVRRRFPLIVVFLLAASAPSVYAQTNAGEQKLSTLIENMFGPRGLIVDSDVYTLDGKTHMAHFNSDFQTNIKRLNIAIASQLSGLPLPSPASGFTYRFDEDTGTFVRSTQSLGPILTERAETIGRGKTQFGYNVQVYSFDELDGVNLGHVPAVFKHDDAQLGGVRADVVDTDNSVKLSVSQFTGLVTFGITDRLDAAVAIPIVRTHLEAASTAVIHRFGTTRESAVHFFEDPSIPGGIGDQRDFAVSGTASGIGDIVARAKATVMRRGSAAIAAGAEVRFPSGAEEDLLGSGAWGAKPFAVLSFAYKNVSPHINLGYQWNGRSILAGDVADQVAADLPDRFMFAWGVDSGISKRVSIALDYLADRVMNSPQLQIAPLRVSGPLGSAVFPDLSFLTGSYWNSNGSAGLKLALREGLLANFNVRFNIGGQGLADRATPLVGLEYTF